MASIYIHRRCLFQCQCACVRVCVCGACLMDMAVNCCLQLVGWGLKKNKIKACIKNRSIHLSAEQVMKIKVKRNCKQQRGQLLG